MFIRSELKEKAKTTYRKYTLRVILAGAILWMFSNGIEGSGTGVTYEVSDIPQEVQTALSSFLSPLARFIPLISVVAIIAAIVISILLTPITAKVKNYYKDLSLDIANPNPFAAIEKGVFLKLVAVEILAGIGIAIGMILLVAPGIYLSYAWRYVGLVAIDNPEYSISEIFRASNEMTKGSKLDLFILDLSFSGWYFVVAIASVISFGILGVVGSIVLIGYTTLTDVEAYKTLANNE